MFIYLIRATKTRKVEIVKGPPVGMEGGELQNLNANGRETPCERAPPEERRNVNQNR